MLLLLIACLASADIVVEKSAVFVKTPAGFGSGVVICTKTGPIVLTNKHVIGNFSRANISVSQNVLSKPTAVIDKQKSKDDDVAYLVLARTANAWDCAHLGTREATPGELAYTWGFPGDKVSLEFSSAILSAGYVSATAKKRLGIGMHIHQGNSGEAVFLKREPGVVVGLLKTKGTPWIFEDEAKHLETIELLKLQTNLSTIQTLLPDGRKVPELMDIIARMMQSWSAFHSSFAHAVSISQIRGFLQRAKIELVEKQYDKQDL